VRVEEQTTQLAGTLVFYRRAPASDPPPLYLHGIPTSSDDWVGMLERGGGLAPDLIGFGRSAKGGHLDYTIDGLAAQVALLLDHLEIERVALVGHDWGAAVGVELARNAPERVERLVLCNPLPLLPDLPWPRHAKLWRRRLVGELTMGATTKWILGRALRAASADPAAWTSARLDAVWQQFDQGTQRAILRLHRATDERYLAATANAIHTEVMQPTLIIWGERDPWLPVAAAERYAQTLPRARLHRLQGAGHWPWLDEGDTINEIFAFLR
jgi:pimeloyl-ACP methyl ester carboxylesterase